MKYAFTLLLAVFAVGTLSACKTTADFKNDRYSIDGDHGYNGHFCPPGQAKKGNC